MLIKLYIYLIKNTERELHSRTRSTSPPLSVAKSAVSLGNGILFELKRVS